jgi:hypothetical protein
MYDRPQQPELEHREPATRFSPQYAVLLHGRRLFGESFTASHAYKTLERFDTVGDSKRFLTELHRLVRSGQ